MFFSFIAVRIQFPTSETGVGVQGQFGDSWCQRPQVLLFLALLCVSSTPRSLNGLKIHSRSNHINHIPASRKGSYKRGNGHMPAISMKKLDSVTLYFCAHIIVEHIVMETHIPAKKAGKRNLYYSCSNALLTHI